MRKKVLEKKWLYEWADLPIAKEWAKKIMQELREQGWKARWGWNPHSGASIHSYDRENRVWIRHDVPVVWVRGEEE